MKNGQPKCYTRFKKCLSRNKIIFEVFYYIAAPSVVIVAIFSYYNSKEALNISEKLRADADKVTISFGAAFDQNIEIEIAPNQLNQRSPIIKAKLILVVANLNPYRAIIIERIYPTLLDGNRPSELELLDSASGQQIKIFTLLSNQSRNIEATIYWPINRKLSEFIESYKQNNNGSLTIAELYRQLKFHPELLEIAKKEKIILDLRTMPRAPKNHEPKTELGLF